MLDSAYALNRISYKVYPIPCYASQTGGHSASDDGCMLPVLPQDEHRPTYGCTHVPCWAQSYVHCPQCPGIWEPGAHLIPRFVFLRGVLLRRLQGLAMALMAFCTCHICVGHLLALSFHLLRPWRPQYGACLHLQRLCAAAWHMAPACTVVCLILVSAAPRASRVFLQRCGEPFFSQRCGYSAFFNLEAQKPRPSLGPLVPRSCGRLVLWSLGPLVPRSPGPWIPWCLGLVRWCCGPNVPWPSGPLVLWASGPLALQIGRLS